MQTRPEWLVKQLKDRAEALRKRRNATRLKKWAGKR